MQKQKFRSILYIGSDDRSVQLKSYLLCESYPLVNKHLSVDISYIFHLTFLSTKIFFCSETKIQETKRNE